MKISKRLLSYCLPYLAFFLLLFILIVLTTVAINFLPVIIQKITDQCLITQNPNIDERLNLLVKLSILYISIGWIRSFNKIFTRITYGLYWSKNNF